jgi:TolB-like protein/tetratricopeptide (TPR) repeat protein
MSLAPGDRLGPYEVLAPLGAGGMGEVYRARDTRLGREVALKVLPAAVASDERRLRRFEQEARSASALNHPNIVTIHDVGETDGVPWIAMERVEGASLRQRLAADRLPLEQALAIGLQVAQGLARAHAAGVVHRDLKPENVMVTPDGRAKILDFGLAKAAPGAAPGGSQAETSTQATEAGAVVGTVGYMSPEQATGRPVDHRSDQFALGAILYELATGRRAFQRASAVETLSAILREEPAPLRSLSPDVPEPLDRIVRRCLSKDPAGRYDSTQDLALDLAAVREPGALAGPPSDGPARRPRRVVWLGLVGLAAAALAAAWIAAHRRAPPAASSDRDRSIAVLPFQNVGGRAEDEYFADGMTDSLITEVARVRELLVIARNSAFHYKGAPLDVRAVGEKLGVRYVLEGSVQRAGGSVRVNAHLVDAATGYSLWAEKYDRPTKEVFALQDDISRNVVAALKLALTPAQVPGRPPPTSNLEAYDAFLRGTFFANAFGWSEKDKAVPHFERAVALDPDFADAHAALAAQYVRRAFEKDPDRQWEQRAFVEIEKALALDPQLAQAYLARGNLSWTLVNHFPHEKAASDFRKAIELNPNLAAAHGSLGSLYLHTGLLEKALAEYRLALKIDPHDLDSLYRVPRVHLYQLQYAEALAGLQATPEFRADFQVPLALAHLGRLPEAVALADTELTNPTHSMQDVDRASTRAVVFALAGDRRAAESSLAAAQAGAAEGSSHFHHAAYGIGCAYALLGRKAEALVWLRRTAEEGMPCYPLFAKDPFLNSLRGEPEFEAFLEELHAEWERLSKVL